MTEHISPVDLLLAFDGELSPQRDEAVRAHCRECAACEEQWARLADVSREVASIQCPNVRFGSEEAATATLLASLDHVHPQRTVSARLWANTLAAAAIAAIAFISLPAPEPPSHPRGPGGPGGPGEMRGFGPGGEFRGMEGRTVAGSPYSAQIVSTSTQTLADGSHITRTLNATVARDSQGRTYRQQVMQNLGPVSTGSHTVVFLRDPVAGQSHVLSVEGKTDMASTMPQHRRGPQSTTPPSPSTAAPQIHTRKGETVESLGPQMIEGVMADGTRITRTIPAGTIGNEHDLKIVSEIWYSKDLQMVVMSKHTDPRMGESTFKMTNITRTEPDPTLFQVPAGFKTTTTGRRGR